MPTSFSPEEWSRIEAILDDVLELEPPCAGGRHRACTAGNPRLRADLEALVAADAGASLSSKRRRPSMPRGSSARRRPRKLKNRGQAGELIGPYRIIKEIGHGGMGRVFLADRADGQFEQHVALKMSVRSGPATAARSSGAFCVSGRFSRDCSIPTSRGCSTAA